MAKIVAAKLVARRCESAETIFLACLAPCCSAIGSKHEEISFLHLIIAALQQARSISPKSLYNASHAALQHKTEWVTDAATMNHPKETTMNKTVEQFSATAKDNLTTLQNLATKAQADAAKLVELNLATSKEVLAESFETAKAMLDAKDPQALAALQASLAKPLADKAAAYAQQVQTIVAGASADFTKTAQANLAEAQKGFTTLMASTTKNAPAGTESMVAFFNQAMTATQEAFKTAQSAAQQAIDVAQSNFTAVSKQTADAVKKASK